MCDLSAQRAMLKQHTVEPSKGCGINVDGTDTKGTKCDIRPYHCSAKRGMFYCSCPPELAVTPSPG